MLAAVFVNIRLFPMHPGLRPEDCERCAGPLVSNRRPAGYWNAEDGGENEFAPVMPAANSSHLPANRQRDSFVRLIAHDDEGVG